MTRIRIAALALWGLSHPIPRLVAAQEPVPASTARAHQLRGLVRDSSGAPVPQAEVTVIERAVAQRQVLTDIAGRFEVKDVPVGRIAIGVHRLGYQTRTIEVVVGDSQPTVVEITLRPVPAQLEEVLVTPEVQGRLREFYQHRQQRKAFARFLEHVEIERLAPASPSELFRSMPGITIRASSTGGNTIRIRGCQPTVWVDGQRIPGAELDDVVQPNDIGGIEFYPSSAGIPPQYLDPTNRLCGLILVWSRTQ